MRLATSVLLLCAALAPFPLWRLVAADTAIAQAPSTARTNGGAAARARTYSYAIEKGTAADGYRPGDEELAAWAMKAWERNAAGTLRFVETSDDAPRVRVMWVNARAGQYGETAPVPGTRGASVVFISADTDALGGAIAEAARRDPLLRDAIVYLTCLHELGHAIGLAHTSDERDIMYSFQYVGDIRAYFARYRNQLTRREDIATTSGLSVDDIERLRALPPDR